MHEQSIASPSPGQESCPIFSMYAPRLTANGFAPVPIRPGTKAPFADEWPEAAADPRMSAVWARRWPFAGLGVACGHGGLVAVDIDTAIPEAVAAIASVLPPSSVEKVGLKGRTAFFRVAAPIASRKLMGRDGRPLIEIIAKGGCTVVPPTVHPGEIDLEATRAHGRTVYIRGTARPYRWTTSATLFDTAPVILLELSGNIADRLAEALAQWLKPKSTPDPRNPAAALSIVGLDNPQLHRRYAACARARLDNMEKRLAETAIGGRYHATFRFGAALGVFVRFGVLAEAEILDAVKRASEANGYAAEASEAAIKASVRAGIERAAEDLLPVLPDRPFRGGRRHG
jgi:hypothetical protein